MCVAAFAWRVDPRWPLVVIANRDEFHARPADPLHAWSDRDVIAGRDRESGGTWLGVNEARRLALVTNLRGFGMADPQARSRGKLVTDCIDGEVEAALAQRYNAFNLLVADHQSAIIHTNLPEPRRIDIAPGFHGLSNGPIGQAWPKTTFLQDRLRDWLANDSDDVAPLFAALASRKLPDDHAGRGPQNIPPEALRSPPFILDPVYGTRCSTVLAIAADGQAIIEEHRFDAAGESSGSTQIEFHKLG